MSKRPPPPKPAGPPTSPKVQATGTAPTPANRPAGRIPPPKPNAPPPRATLRPTPNAPKAPPPPKGPPGSPKRPPGGPPGLGVAPGSLPGSPKRPPGGPPGSPKRPPGGPPGSPKRPPGGPPGAGAASGKPKAPPPRVQPGAPSIPPPPSKAKSPSKPMSPPPPKSPPAKSPIGKPPPPRIGKPAPPVVQKKEGEMSQDNAGGKPKAPPPSAKAPPRSGQPLSPTAPPPRDAIGKKPPPASPPPRDTIVKKPPPASPPPSGVAGKRPPPASPPPSDVAGKRPPPASPPPSDVAGKRPPPASPPPSDVAGKRPPPASPPPSDVAGKRPPPASPPPSDTTGISPPGEGDVLPDASVGTAQNVGAASDELESFLGQPQSAVDGDNILPPPGVQPPPEQFGGPPPPSDGIPPPPSDGIPPPPTDGIPPPPDLVPPPPDMAPPPPLVPPPEEDFGNVDLDDLAPGRFTITTHEARDIGRRDAKSAVKATKIDPYVKVTLGKAKNAPQEKTKVIKKSGKAVNFKDEKLKFNVADLREIEQNGKMSMQIQIWDSNMLSDTLLGQVEIPIVPLIQEFNISKWYNLHVPTKSGDVAEAGQIRLSLKFQPARKGGLFIKCVEGRNLKNMETFGKQDPYCQFELGKLKKKSKTHKKGGTSPSWGGEEIWFWIDSKAWFNDIVFSCFDEDIGSDDLIGRTMLDILGLMSQASNLAEYHEEGLLAEKEHVIDIFQKGKKSGEVVLGIQFMPSGKLTITSIEGRNLLEKDSIGRQDPYIEYTTLGAIANHKRKTKVDTDGGANPIWNEESVFAILDHHEMTMEVYDYDRFGSNDLIGGASFSLLEVFKKGSIDTWVQLKHRDTWGKITPCGEVHVLVDFVGPKGVAYPLRKPDIMGFDDSERIDRRKQEKEDLLRDREQAELQEAKRYGLVPDDDMANEFGDSSESKKEFVRSDEFNDDEIRDAFSFIDLNKNGFIGAAEIRHVLVCMGELITDEEVDEMIGMVDTDGDGQVSFEEFYALIVDPDPGRSDFDPQVVVEQMQAAAERKTREEAERRAQDMRVKNEKIALMNKFARDNGIKFQNLKRAFQKFTALDTNFSGRISFETFCDVMEVEATGEYSRLYQLFTDDISESSLADYRALLLGLNNFTGATTEMRVEFAFNMYDTDHNGFITMEELTAILKANHMASDGASVAKKAATIMKQADGDDDNKIDLDEFLVISKKFPNILFPATLTVPS